MAHAQWLETFLCVVECGSFTRAGERLELTQAAVSQQIQRLEAEFGPLLLRKARQLELTPNGRLVMAYAREQQQALTRLKSALANDDPFSGRFRLYTPGSIGLFIYPRLLAWQQQHPGLVIEHRFAPTGTILQALLNDEAEVGLSTRQPDDPRLTCHLFAREALCLVLPASAPFSNEAPPQWADLCQLGFIDHPDGSDMAQRLFSRRYPGSSLATLPRRGITNQISLILEPVALGLGFTVLPHFAVMSFAKSEQIRIITQAPALQDNLWLIHRAEWPLPSRIELAMAELGRQLQEAHQGY